MEAHVTWSDGTVEVVPLTPAGGNAYALSIRNPGKPDHWGNAWVPEPKFFSSVTIHGLPAGYINPLGNIQDTQYNPDGSLTVVSPTAYKYQHTRYQQITHQAYGPCANFHAIDGGSTLYFRFSPADDVTEDQLLGQVTLETYVKALQILDLDEQRIAQWPFLAKVMSLFESDASTFSSLNPNGGTKASWLLIPEHFFARWSGSVTNGPLASLKHWYGFGTHAAGEGFSSEHYGHDMAYMAQALRLYGQGANDPLILAKAKMTMTTGLYLLRYKIAYGLIDTDANVFHKGRWRNEKSDVASFRGTAGTQPGPAKEYDRSLCVAYTLCPTDPLIARAFNVRKAFWLAAYPQWDGGGGCRALGWTLSNLLDFYKTTGDDAFKQKAEAEISHAFSNAINGMNILWFREYVQTSPQLGEGLTALTNCLRWVVNHGVRPDLLPHLQAMLNWYLSYTGMWNGPTKWKAGYYGDNATATSCNVTYNSEISGVWSLGLKPFCNPSQLQQMAAIENQIYSAYSASTFDADFGGMGPSHEKWTVMFVESARK